MVPMASQYPHFFLNDLRRAVESISDRGIEARSSVFSSFPTALKGTGPQRIGGSASGFLGRVSISPLMHCRAIQTRNSSHSHLYKISDRPRSLRGDGRCEPAEQSAADCNSLRPPPTVVTLNTARRVIRVLILWIARGFSRKWHQPGGSHGEEI